MASGEQQNEQSPERLVGRAAGEQYYLDLIVTVEELSHDAEGLGARAKELRDAWKQGPAIERGRRDQLYRRFDGALKLLFARREQHFLGNRDPAAAAAGLRALAVTVARSPVTPPQPLPGPDAPSRRGWLLWSVVIWSSEFEDMSGRSYYNRTRTEARELYLLDDGSVLHAIRGWTDSTGGDDADPSFSAQPASDSDLFLPDQYWRRNSKKISRNETITGAHPGDRPVSPPGSALRIRLEQMSTSTSDRR